MADGGRVAFLCVGAVCSAQAVMLRLRELHSTRAYAGYLVAPFCQKYV